VFEVGDVVVVHKPRNTNESPRWVYLMDKFDGQEMEIKKITQIDGYSVINFYEGEGFNFRDSWLEPLLEDDAYECEELQIFLDEFKVKQVI
jgi:hypothetical protein